MKYFFKKNYLILLCVVTIFVNINSQAYCKNSSATYSKEDISNYFIGIVSSNQDYVGLAFKHLNKVQYLKDSHSTFKVEFVRTLILLGKFEEAFDFSKKTWLEDELFFEADLLLGIESFINEDYKNAKKYFKRLNNIYGNNLVYDDLMGNLLLSWVESSENNKKNSLVYLDQIPNRYRNLKKIQNSFLQCYFDTPKTLEAYNKLIEDENYTFSRYNFFLVNYLINKNKLVEAKKIISIGRDKHNSNLLLKQTENFISKNNLKKIRQFFDCKKPKHNIAEIFYIIANLYSSEKNYQMSNFYLKLSLFLNKKFTPNKTLLAENLFYQKKYENSKKIYNSLKSIGSVYSWHASQNVATILSVTSDNESSISHLEKQFNLISNPNFDHYYDLANFYKDNEYYEESIKYYSLAMENIAQNHFLIPKILDRRGTSYERIGEWQKAEKDLKQSLKILPEQPYVLNYLAYSWIEKKINIDKALKMLKKATELKKNDGYIIDSLGWAHFMNKNYFDAEKYLRTAVQLMPMDPIINDHYADVLWMTNKDIQARYFWNHVLTLDKTDKELKKNVNNKLIFGINEKL